jgi:hypothetical protein
MNDVMLSFDEHLSLIFKLTLTRILKPYRMIILPTWDFEQGLVLYSALNENLI